MSSDRSEVFYKLNSEEKQRYLNKLALIGGLDPYTLQTAQLCEDTASLPTLSYADITVYLLHTTSFVTLEEVKNYKSLKSYKYFIAGWVVFHKWKRLEDKTVVIGRVNHSYAVSSPPVHPWVIIQNNGTVICGHCTCMAGLGETCSHVGALLYWVEYQVRRHQEVSCTSVTNTWLEPHAVANAPYLQLKDIDFSSAEKKIKVLEAATTPKSIATVPSTSTGSASVEPTTSELKRFYDKCLDSDPKPILFSMLEAPYSDSFLKSSDHLPLSLQSIFNPDNLTREYLELVEIGRTILLKVTPLQQQHLEELTRSQSKSKLWMKFRSGRVTSSRFYHAVHTNPHKPSLSLVVGACYPDSVKFTSAATQYGLEHEKTAIKAYKELQMKQHIDFKVSPAGFVVSTKKPCFGASPDSFVECKCCGRGVLEVKCPYTARQANFRQLMMKPGFCLAEVDNKLTLKRSHQYYYQCQLHLMVTESQFCDFVVWTPNGEVHVERIFPDEGFWAEATPQAEEFFSMAILPELLGKWFTKDRMMQSETEVTDCMSDDDGSWCFCKESKGGRMVGCTNRSCTIQWFHLDCLKMKDFPKGKWLCPTCRTKKKRRGKAAMP